VREENDTLIPKRDVRQQICFVSRARVNWKNVRYLQFYGFLLTPAAFEEKVMAAA
jgi:hypothetical protein